MTKRINAMAWDILGDVHGCFAEMDSLITTKLGYHTLPDGGYEHPDGRKLAWVGDLVDRGPDVMSVLRSVKATIDAGNGVSVMGNHEDMYIDWYLNYQDGPSNLNHMFKGNLLHRNGTDVTVSAISESKDGHKVWFEFMRTLPVVAFLGLEGSEKDFVFLSHAGTGSSEVEPSEGLPHTLGYKAREWLMWNRNDDIWAPGWEYRAHDDAICVYGHTPQQDPLEIAPRRTFMIDTGCYYGNALTALRYPELEYMSVPSQTNPNVHIIGRNVHV